MIGKGTFGVVYQAKTSSGELVAIKKVFQDKRYKNREHQIIKELNCSACVKMKNVFFTYGKSADEVYLNIVMDYIPFNLYEITKNIRKSKKGCLSNLELKIYAYQMFRALSYIHSKGICHRDIKPQNLLVNPATYVIKLCDFGSAKKLVKGEPNIAYICSRYYRAPELIFGATDYSYSVDTWSTGCCLAEAVLLHPLFPGDSSVNQLIEIIKVLGSPTQAQVEKMNPDYKEDFSIQNIKAKPWEAVFSKQKVDPLFLDLLEKVLVYEPDKRLTPLEVLIHPFFDEIKKPNFKIEGVKIPDIFDFTPG